MDKFDKWNKIKKKTHKITRKLGIKPREIFWAKIGQNIGDEEYGKGENFARPVIVIKQLSKDLFIGIPTTTAQKEDNDYYHNINYINNKNEMINSSAMILQIRVFSKKRLTSKLGKISKDDFEKIQEKMLKVLFPLAEPRTQ